MGRARRSTFSLVLVLVALAALTIAVPPRAIQVVEAAAVGWPTSTLLLSEVVTGGASASDEFIELVNAGAATVDLAGLEVVYVTSSGSTVTPRRSLPRGAVWRASATGSSSPNGASATWRRSSRRWAPAASAGSSTTLVCRLRISINPPGASASDRGGPSTCAWIPPRLLPRRTW